VDKREPPETGRGFRRWLVTNPAVAFVVITLSFAAGLVAFFLLYPYEYLTTKPDIGSFWAAYWSALVVFCPPALILVAPLGGLITCQQKGKLTLQAWWRGTALALQGAVFLAALGWAENTMKVNNPRVLAALAGYLESHAQALLLIAFLVCAPALWKLLVELIKAFREAVAEFNKARRGE
jgi:hypothetical protein